MSEVDPDDDVRRLLDRDGVRTSARHDETVLAAARAFAAEAANRAPPLTRAAPAPGRTRRWLVPVALAASFVAGMMVRAPFERAALPDTNGSEPALVLPLDTTRGAALERRIPVEQARPDDWYRYIQELVAAGQTHEAERHLRRFNELHPDYVHQP
jgi:hypothetical protein